MLLLGVLVSGKLFMKKPKIVKLICILLALIILWVLAVDMSWFVEDCHDCFYSKDIFEFRLFTLPIYRIVREHDSPIAYTAEKLGMPCSHLNIDRWHKHRWWGFVICCYPCINGVSGLAWPEGSERELIDMAIPKLLEKNPNLPAEFKQRVLIDHDMEYWKELRKTLLPQDAPDQETWSK